MPPITLNKRQFLAKRPGGNYSAYLDYVERYRSAHPAQPKPGQQGHAPAVDPFAPSTPGQLTQQAHQEIDPVVAALTRSIDSKAAQASSAITANSSAAAKALAGIDYQAPYRTAETQQGAVDAALRDSLAGGGQGLADSLSSRLAMVGDPAVAAAAGKVSDTGTAAGTTEQARGSASLSSLLEHAAAAGSYGTKMPGVARLAGLQDVAKTEQGAVNDVADARTQLLQQLPGLLQHLHDTELQKAVARQSGLLTATKTGDDTAYKAAMLQQRKDELAARSATDTERTRIEQQNADTSAYRAAAAAKTAEERVAIARNAKKTGSKLTAAQRQKFMGVALTVATQAHDGAAATHNADGSVKDPELPKLSYAKAILEMEKEGVPAWIAIATANRVYGKPLTKAQQAKQDKAVASGQGIGTAVSDVFPG